MRINELLEDKSSIFDFFKDTPALNIGGTTLSAGQIADPLLQMGVSKDQVVNGVSWLAKKSVEPIPGLGEYTYGEAFLDGALGLDLLATVLTGGLAAAALPEIIAARAGVTAAKTVAKKGLTDAEKTALGRGAKYGAAQAAKSQISIPGSDGSGASTPSGDIGVKKRTRYNVGDKIPVTYGGKTIRLPVIAVLPTGYEVTTDEIPGQKPGGRLAVPEPAEMLENSSSPVTAGNIASLGNSPHVAVGSKATIRRWGGSPGKMGKSPDVPKAKPQSASDNPVTNPKVGGSLIS